MKRLLFILLLGCDPLPVRPGEAISIELVQPRIEVARRLEPVGVPLVVRGCEDFSLFLPLENQSLRFAPGAGGEQVLAQIPVPLLTERACFDGRRELIELEIGAACRGLEARPVRVEFALAATDGAVPFTGARWLFPGAVEEQLLALSGAELALSVDFDLSPPEIHPYHVAAESPVAAWDPARESLYVAIGCLEGDCGESEGVGLTRVRVDALPIGSSTRVLSVPGEVVAIHAESAARATIVSGADPVRFSTFADGVLVEELLVPGRALPAGDRIAVVSTASLSLRSLRGEEERSLAFDASSVTAVAADAASLAWLSELGVFLHRDGAVLQLETMDAPRGLVLDGSAVAVWRDDRLEWFEGQTLAGSIGLTRYSKTSSPFVQPLQILEVVADRGRWVVVTETGVRVLDRFGTALGGVDPLPCERAVSGRVLTTSRSRIAVPTLDGAVYLLDLQAIR